MSRKKGLEGFVPTKRCAGCDRVFRWRKEWSRCWHRIAYCSPECRDEPTDLTTPPPDPTSGFQSANTDEPNPQAAE